MKFLVDVIKGMLVGVANVIPGVSGGTMMVSMGIYEKIIGVVNNLFKDIKKSILTLLPIGIGLVLGVAVFSFIIPFIGFKVLISLLWLLLSRSCNSLCHLDMIT